VSRVQAAKVCAITRDPVLIALDGDQAGAGGTACWPSQIAILGRSAQSVRLPAGVDPAELIADNGPAGLQPSRVLTHACSAIKVRSCATY
jgi:DNA primase